MSSAQTYVNLIAVALSVPLAACSTSVTGDDDASYGDVTVTVSHLDPAGNPLGRDERRGPGDQLVAPLDRPLHDPIAVDGAEVDEPSLLFDAARAEIRLPTGAVVALTRSGDRLLADGPSLFAVRSARRSGDTLSIEIEGGRFDIQLTGDLSPESADRFLATALVRMVRGEALLADDCRPDCLYSVNPVSWVCDPVRDWMTNTFGGDCAGPMSSEAWAAMVAHMRTEGKRDTCYQLWLVPRPICEWAYDFAVDSALEYIAPDADGMVCAEAFYRNCTGQVDDCTAPE